MAARELSDAVWRRRAQRVGVYRTHQERDERIPQTWAGVAHRLPLGRFRSGAGTGISVRVVSVDEEPCGGHDVRHGCVDQSCRNAMVRDDGVVIDVRNRPAAGGFRGGVGSGGSPRRGWHQWLAGCRSRRRWWSSPTRVTQVQPVPLAGLSRGARRAPRPW